MGFDVVVRILAAKLDKLVVLDFSNFFEGGRWDIVG
jgi:hypothetical protein